MADTPNPLRPQLAGAPAQALRPSGYPGYRKGRSPGNAGRGRLLLVAIFFALRVGDALVCYAGATGLHSPVAAAVITGCLWTTALLAGIWFRQEWCRWALMVALLLSILSAVWILRPAFDLPLHYTQVLVLLAVALINAGAAWAIVKLRDIRRITSRSHASRPYGYN
jgi:hypothetical protein